MIGRLFVVFMAVASSVLSPMPSASAGCQYVSDVVLVQGTAQINTVLVCSDDSDGGAENTAVIEPPRDSDWDAICVRTALAVGEDPVRFCDLPPSAAVPTLTPGLVAAAFRNLPLPASTLVVQPPGGRTLVNFATNFYTESGPFTRTVTLLGQRVELRIWPSRFGWRFGDGEQVSTTSAGTAYPDLEITHDYLRAGGVSPSVDTTYAAQFSVNGGAWRDVTGTVTISGSPVGLEVITASPVLVGYR